MNSDAAELWGEPRIEATVQHIHERADTTPRLTAVRYSGNAVSYGDLAESLAEYERVARGNGMSVGAAVVAGVLHCMPRVCDVHDSGSLATTVSEIIDWLGRDLDTGYGSLRAVS